MAGVLPDEVGSFSAAELSSVGLIEGVEIRCLSPDALFAQFSDTRRVTRRSTTSPHSIGFSGHRCRRRSSSPPTERGAS
jgi:hypothetical protein